MPTTKKTTKSLEVSDNHRIFAAEKKGDNNMKLQKIKLGNENIVPSGAVVNGISVRRSGIAKVLWRKLDKKVPASQVIKDGVATYKD